jgi:hypothetical protein
MSEDFDPFPRTSKRRKVSTYGSGRSITAEKDNPVSSIWDNVSSSVTGLSRRLFSASKSGTHAEDSAVESQEDSNANGESQEPGQDLQEIAESENEVVEEPVARPRRDTRQGQRSNTATPASSTRRKSAKTGSGKARAPVEGIRSAGRKQRAGAATKPALGGLPGSMDDAPANSGGEITHNEEEETITVQPRSSGRERKKTRKYEVEPAEIQESPRSTTKSTTKQGPVKQTSIGAKKAQQPALVGILTPSKRNEKRARKSVVFVEGEKQTETDFGFRDISSSNKKTQEPTSESLATPALAKPPKKSKQKPQEEAIEIQAEVEADIGVDEDHLFETLPPPEPVVEIAAIQDDNTAFTEDSPELLHTKATVLFRLTDQAASTERPPLPSHLQLAYETLHTLLRTTISSGESNSLLLLGSRGAGKSLLVSTALSNLHRDLSPDFHTVRLNGFIQTDDRLALREIWRQLGREMDVDENETNQVVGSYADTMTSLLGLLSQPEEVPDIGAVEYIAEKVITKSVVFILDEFDLFTTHPRQTLLYNLFDIAQSRKAPIAVIGCSARTDCVECLEKRVKSRFSHRWVHVGQPRNLAAFEDVVKENMLVDENLLGDTAQEQECAGIWNEYITVSIILTNFDTSLTTLQNTFLPSPSIQSLISSTFYTTKSLPTLFAALYHPIATANPPNAPHLIGPSPPSLLSLLLSLPHVHLALLICATRLEAIHSLTTCNFNIVHAHYTDLLTKSRISGGATASGTRTWGRDVCLRAWEELVRWELVVRVGRDEGGGLDAGMCRVDVAIEEVRWAVENARGGGVGEGLGRWCREV